MVTPRWRQFARIRSERPGHTTGDPVRRSGRDGGVQHVWNIDRPARPARKGGPGHLLRSDVSWPTVRDQELEADEWAPASPASAST